MTNQNDANETLKCTLTIGKNEVSGWRKVALLLVTSPIWVPRFLWEFAKFSWRDSQMSPMLAAAVFSVAGAAVMLLAIPVTNSTIAGLVMFCMAEVFMTKARMKC